MGAFEEAAAKNTLWMDAQRERVAAEKETRQTAKTEAELWGKIAGDIEPERQAKMRDVVEWVFNSVMLPLNCIVADDVPSLGALGMLKWARGENYDGFMQVWKAMLPKTTEEAPEAKYLDDGRKQLALLDAFESEEAA